LVIARDGAGIIEIDDHSRHLLAQKSGDDLGLGFIVEKPDFVIVFGIIEQDFRHDLVLRPAAHNDFIHPHGRIVIGSVPMRKKFAGCV